ncbi:Hypothetical predicted protein [Paramuricea clavata]|uniref:Uncharacterized protein n=1 Tax=Paramuricea clavata TaxID=317549 RepID=A0A6S7JLC2_PARCT|nr:Hypothetical predicted protein [Paramuricea clavata]
MSPWADFDKTTVLMTQTSQSDYENLRRLNVLGIADSGENYQEMVYQDFKEKRAEAAQKQQLQTDNSQNPQQLNPTNGQRQNIAAENLDSKDKQKPIEESAPLKPNLKDGKQQVEDQPKPAANSKPPSGLKSKGKSPVGVPSYSCKDLVKQELEAIKDSPSTKQFKADVLKEENEAKHGIVHKKGEAKHGIMHKKGEAKHGIAQGHRKLHGKKKEGKKAVEKAKLNRR